MRNKLILHCSVLIVLPWSLLAATNDLTGALQRGLFEEEANRNLDAAAQAYQAVSAQFDKDRKLAATAIFRLGEVYRKQGRTNEALAQYERIVREFADEPTLATLSRQNLVGLRQVPVLGDFPMQAGLGNASEEAVQLTARLKAIEQLRDNPEEQARAVLSFFPDETLKKMLLQLPKLKEQETILRAYPQADATSTAVFEKLAAKLGYSPTANGSSYHTAFGPDGLTLEAHSTNLLTDAQHEVRRQLSWIKERVDFTVGIQKARLQILRAVTAKSPAREAGTAEKPTLAADDEEKEIRRIQAMIQDSPDLINAARGMEGTPLCTAASKGQLRIAAFLLDHGADINLNGPLRRAASGGHKAMVELLLARGADVNAADNEGVTALQLAADNGFLSVTEALLNAKADPNLRDVSSQTALTRAAKKGFFPVVAKLLARGADPNVACKVHPRYSRNEVSEGRAMYGTPLHFAAARGDATLATMLLTNRADVKVRSIYEETPLDIAATLGKTKIAELLLSAGADPNARASSESATPLFTACGAGHRAVAELLLEHGANPNATVYTGWTPLMVAAGWKDAEVVELLLKYKADPNLVDARGNTALLSAVNSRSPEVVRALLAAGADPNTKNEGGYPVLTLSVTDALSKEVASTLIEAKANVNAPDPNGKTPLHWAAQSNRKEFVELFLNADADVNLRDKSGMTPLDLAKGAQRQPQPPPVGLAAQPANLPGRPGSPAKTETTDIATLLRQHGALDELPDFTAIRVKRGSMIPEFVFGKDAASLNRFTLLEAILASLNPDGRPAPQNFLFPDLSNIRIHRFSPQNPTDRKEIVVNVLTSTNTIDCSKDVPLEFGDVIEIPERDHALSEPPVILTPQQRRELVECTTRKFRVSASGGALEIGLASPRAFLSTLFSKTSAVQNILRSTSDLSRVKIKRVDPASGKTQEFLRDAQNEIRPQDDLWLQEGDVVEVPNKP